MQRFTAGDHNKSGTGFGGGLGFASQLSQGALGVQICRPGVFGVAPGAGHRAAPQADEESAAAGLQAFTLEGVEGFNYWQGSCWQRIGGQGLGHRAEGNGIARLV
jgi:hypothetical protein